MKERLRDGEVEPQARPHRRNPKGLSTATTAAASMKMPLGVNRESNTAWEAITLSNDLVAIKVAFVRLDPTTLERELHMYNELPKAVLDSDTSHYFLGLEEHFQPEGPNGRHNSSTEKLQQNPDDPTKITTPRALRAPETILKLPVGPKFHVWSFGCLAFELLTGHALVGLPSLFLEDAQNIINDEHLIKLPDITGRRPDRLFFSGLPLIRVCLFILRPNYPWSPATPTAITSNRKPSTCLLATLSLRALFNVLAQRAAWIGRAARLHGVRQRAEGISAATRLASDQAVILAHVVPSVGPSAVVNCSVMCDFGIRIPCTRLSLNVYVIVLAITRNLVCLSWNLIEISRLEAVVLAASEGYRFHLKFDLFALRYDDLLGSAYAGSPSTAEA
ncbi:hypothetical protein LA080_003817 [Diaporthe eres]|nr:hypothetical protein LA080_003817 [Diaporthe eres]